MVVSIPLYDPHHALGIHIVQNGWEIRILRPGWEYLWFELKGIQIKLDHSESGLFIYKTDSQPNFSDYKVFHSSGLLAEDPYSFPSSFGDTDQELFSKGIHHNLFEVMGGRLITHLGVRGARFTVWAPDVKGVSVVGDFNSWDGRVNPMRCLGYSGVWELFIPGLESGNCYKFEILTQDDQVLLRIDPYALAFEQRPQTSAMLIESQFQFTDQDWLEKRTCLQNKPFNVYELHFGSWKRGLGYREAAQILGPYVKEMGFTHVEFMPITEHPRDISWGYLSMGYFSPTSRFGTLDDFKYLINYLHSLEIGVILDWVPGHFSSDSFSLNNFVGRPLYEQTHPKQAWHPEWGAYIFNFGRPEVRNFMIASALYWLQELHLDGLRVDAITSIMYLNFGHWDNQWIPNKYGGRENLEAIEFLKELNTVIHEKVPGAVTIAEEWEASRRMTPSISSGGLDFDFKWNVGWTTDTLAYLSKDPLYRKYHQNDLTFSIMYAFSERHVLVISHDQMVYGRGSLMTRFPGSSEQKFAQVRLFFAYMMTHPGKKLLFMGQEFGQISEWDYNSEINWHVSYLPDHYDLKNYVKELNYLYLKESALWTYDSTNEGFEWVDISDKDNSIISFLRKDGKGRTILAVHQFSSNFHKNYTVPLKNVLTCKPILCSDEDRFGGSGRGNKVLEITDQYVAIELPPLSSLIFEVTFSSQPESI